MLRDIEIIPVDHSDDAGVIDLSEVRVLAVIPVVQLGKYDVSGLRVVGGSEEVRSLAVEEVCQVMGTGPRTAGRSANKRVVLVPVGIIVHISWEIWRRSQVFRQSASERQGARREVGTVVYQVPVVVLLGPRHGVVERPGDLGGEVGTVVSPAR